MTQNSDLSAEDARAFGRQEQIWTSLYGPMQAAELMTKAHAERAANPDMAVKAIFTAVEPDGDDDFDEAGTMRPGFG